MVGRMGILGWRVGGSGFFGSFGGGNMFITILALSFRVGFYVSFIFYIFL
jgi:hypothetical protein